MLTRSKSAKRLASPSQGSSWVIILVLTLQALAIPTHLLGMSIQPGDTKHLGSECPMHKDVLGESRIDDSCNCLGGMCSVGSANYFMHLESGQFESVFQDTSRIFYTTFVHRARRENYSIYQSRAPPPISLS